MIAADTTAKTLVAAGLAAGVIGVSLGRWRDRRLFALEVWVAAGVLRLTGDPGIYRVTAAASVIGVRRVVTVGLRHRWGRETHRRDRGPPVSQSRYSTVTWIATLTGAAVIDLAVGREASLTVVLVFAPFVASGLVPVFETALAGAAATALAVAPGWPDATFATGPHLIRVAAVTAGSVLAVRLAIARVKRERRLRALTRVAEVAQQALLRPVPVGLLSEEYDPHRRRLVGWTGSSPAASPSPAGPTASPPTQRRQGRHRDQHVI